jgi:hypothetical protein
VQLGRRSIEPEVSISSITIGALSSCVLVTAAVFPVVAATARSRHNPAEHVVWSPQSSSLTQRTSHTFARLRSSASAHDLVSPTPSLAMHVACDPAVMQSEDDSHS